ncbi:hypothetical protein C1Y63_12025, partial [Corynebacterium sp. 13CS0277]|uniref:integrase core domain-containing protein n=1 Tax=Corynebacterium sp. 13CS0277 TaxID=2071994 RepID=UPI000D4FCD2B
DNLVEGVEHARVLHEWWRVRYNTEHPHSSLGYLPPSRYAALVRAEHESSVAMA